jgi:hypothetical protein
VPIGLVWVALARVRLSRSCGFEPQYDTARATADYIAWLTAGNPTLRVMRPRDAGASHAHPLPDRITAEDPRSSTSAPPTHSDSCDI